MSSSDDAILLRQSPQKHNTDPQEYSVDAFVVNDDDEKETEQQSTDYFGGRCCVRGCVYKRRATLEQLLLCASPTCDKSLHMTCFKKRIVKEDKKMVRRFKHRSSRLSTGLLKKARAINSANGLTWDNDGFGGRDDPNTSIRILLDWLTHEGNYSNL
jgi:hypothetical protein